MLWLRTSRWERRIAELDAKRDAQEIVTILANYVFPVELLLSMELAQLRTFTIPSISKILHGTRQYEHDGLRRLDDTRAIISEIYSTPAGGEEQLEMIEHLNDIHGFYKISNDDYLYTLSTFIFDPPLFLQRFGFRSLTDKEQDAFFYMYLELGEHMGIDELPETRAEFWDWRVNYERREQRYSSANEAVARGFMAAVQSSVAPALARLVEPLSTALMDDEYLTLALGLDLPPRPLVKAVRRVMRSTTGVTRYLNVFERDGVEAWPLLTEYLSYPDGYERLKLGPRRVVEILERRRAKEAKAAS